MNIKNLKDLIKSPLSLQVAVMAWGRPGVGKSEAVNQAAAEIAEETGAPCPVVDLRLSQTDPVDLRGVPWIQHYGDEGGEVVASTTKWGTPEFLPDADRDGEQGILFLDELTAAPQVVQAAAYQLVLDRKLGDYAVPPGWRIVAASNPPGEGTISFAMPKALSNRFLHVEVQPEWEDWRRWAVNKGVDEWIVAFLSQFPQHFNSFRPDSDEHAYPTPRSWSFADKAVKDGWCSSDHWVLQEVLGGIVGKGVATEFVAFMKVAKDMPDLDKILAGGGVERTTEPSVAYAAAIALTSRVLDAVRKGYESSPTPAKAKAAQDAFGNALAWIDSCGSDYAAMYVKDVADGGRKAFGKLTSGCRPYTEWAQKNYNVLVNV